MLKIGKKKSLIYIILQKKLDIIKLKFENATVLIFYKFICQVLFYIYSKKTFRTDCIYKKNSNLDNLCPLSY